MVKTNTPIQQKKLNYNSLVKERTVYVCLYCESNNKPDSRVNTKSITSHVLNCHKNILIENGIQIHGFKIKKDRDYRITDEKVSIQKVKASNQISKSNQQEYKQKLQLINNGYESYESENNSQDQFKNEFNQVLQQFKNQDFCKQVGYLKNNNNKQPNNELLILEQLNCKSIMIQHLVQSSKLAKEGKKAEKLIIEYIDPQKIKVKEIKQLQKTSKLEIKKIEFTNQNIMQQLLEFQEEITVKDMESQLKQILFINKCFSFINETVQEIIGFLKVQQQQIKLEIVSKIKDSHDQHIQDLQQKILSERKEYDQILKLYSYQLQQAEINLESLKNFEQKIPSIPIKADLTKSGTCKNIGEVHKKFTNKKFQVVSIDFAWGINFTTETGQDFIPYNTLSTEKLYNLEIEDLQDEGYLLMWTVAQKFVDAIAFMLLKGYRIVDSICWIKKGSQKKYKKRPGFHLRHSKEICLVGLKGSVPPNMNAFSADDIIEEVPGQNSEKPEAIKDIVEKLCPGGWYIELFARKNNLREGWVSVGDEL